MNKSYKKLSLFLFFSIIFNACSVDNTNSKKKKKDWTDINIENIKEPCDCIIPMVTLVDNMYTLVEENNWKPINDNSDYSKEVNNIQEKMEKIQSLCEIMWNKQKKEEEYLNECENFKKWEEHTNNKARKLFEWLENTTNI